VQAQIEIAIPQALQKDIEKWNIGALRLSCFCWLFSIVLSVFGVPRSEMKDTFMHHNHQCIVFELLSLNLFDLLQSTNFAGVSLSLICKFAKSLLATLGFLAARFASFRGSLCAHKVLLSVQARQGRQGHIHCDLKPENILLRDANKSANKDIDFGGACFSNQKV
jgi:serine/threonine protein kinase